MDFFLIILAPILFIYFLVDAIKAKFLNGIAINSFGLGFWFASMLALIIFYSFFGK